VPFFAQDRTFDVEGGRAKTREFPDVLDVVEGDRETGDTVTPVSFNAS
jgi:hypothetical protein